MVNYSDRKSSVMPKVGFVKHVISDIIQLKVFVKTPHTGIIIIVVILIGILGILFVLGRAIYICCC